MGAGGTILIVFLPPTSRVKTVLWLLFLFAILVYPATHLAKWAIRFSGKFAPLIAIFVLCCSVIAFGYRIWPASPISVKVTFKSSPLFTEARKKRITNILNNFYGYLAEIGFEIPKEVPPLGVAKGLLMSGGTAHGGPYNADMVIPEETLDSPDDMIIRAYAEYLFRELIPENPPNLKQGRSLGEAVRLFADYYRCSFFGRRTVEYPPELDTWEATLWSIREKYGQDFMDKSMFFAIKRWMPYGFARTDTDFDNYFAVRLEMGAVVFDNNGMPLNGIRDLLKERIVGRHLAAINELSDFVTDGNSIEVEFLAKDDADLMANREASWITNVSGGLEQILGHSYSVRFKAARGDVSMAMPAGHNAAGKPVWQDIEAKKVQLNSFIAELRTDGNRAQ